MHLQAAEDLRADIAERTKTASTSMSVETSQKPVDVESQLKLAEILSKGGLPNVSRLDVSTLFYRFFITLCLHLFHFVRQWLQWSTLSTSSRTSKRPISFLIDKNREPKSRRRTSATSVISWSTNSNSATSSSSTKSTSSRRKTSRKRNRSFEPSIPIALSLPLSDRKSTSLIYSIPASSRSRRA